MLMENVRNKKKKQRNESQAKKKNCNPANRSASHVNKIDTQQCTHKYTSIQSNS